MARKSFKKHAIKNNSCSSGGYLVLHRELLLFLVGSIISNSFCQ